MSTYYANKVHKSWNASGTHQHIDFACEENSGTHWTPSEVVASIALGNVWRTRGADGSTAVIHRLPACSVAGCPISPYITTRPDHTTANNLDNLPLC